MNLKLKHNLDRLITLLIIGANLCLAMLALGFTARLLFRLALIGWHLAGRVP